MEHSPPPDPPAGWKFPRLMNPLPPPDCFFVSAAEGWLGLGDPTAAAAELEQVGEAHRHHPAVLDLRWTLYACQKDWTGALRVAREFRASVPGEVASWLHYAYALRRTAEGGLQAAWEELLPALEKFPQDSTVPYNLACYACQLGRLGEARGLLARAAGQNREFIQQMALRDADLEPLWTEIRGWK